MSKYILAITGNIGAGKSEVLNILKKNLFEIINSDIEVNYLYSLYNPNYLTLYQEINTFFDSNFNSDNLITKDKLKLLISTDKKKLNQLMLIIKPHLLNRINDLINSSSNMLIGVELPLLFEANMEKDFNNILLITADKNIRFDRIQKRNPHLSKEQIHLFINSQMDDNLKKNHCQYIINNNNDFNFLENQINQIVSCIKKNNLTI